MANSIKEYPAVASALHTYTTPAYLNVTDIKVYVDDVLQTEGYVINGEALNFTHGHLPQADQTVRIERVSENASRSVDYTDGSLLNAETLDKDATQIFHVAQEAYDQARVTNMASGKFYYSQIDPPTDPVAGTLWYNKSKTPNVLEIYDGSDWYTAAPVKSVQKFTQADVDVVAGDYDSISNVNFNPSTEVYLNGVKLVKGFDYSDLTNDADYWYNTDLSLLWVKDLAADDILEVITYSGGYANQITQDIEDFQTDFASINGRLDVVEPQLTDIENLNVPQVILDINQAVADVDDDKELAKKFATHPHDTTFTDDNAVSQKSALHYATEAADSAEEARITAEGVNDPISGWAALDNETLTTTSSNDPIIYSSGSLTLKAETDIILDGTLNISSGITIQGFTTPVIQGVWDLDTQTWTGTAGVTVANTQSLAWRPVFIHSDLGDDDYVVDACLNSKGATSGLNVATVELANGQFEVQCQQVASGGGTNSLSSNAKLLVQVYKF